MKQKTVIEIALLAAFILYSLALDANRLLVLIGILAICFLMRERD
jgi:hypothetical protein